VPICNVRPVPGSSLSTCGSLVCESLNVKWAYQVSLVQGSQEDHSVLYPPETTPAPRVRRVYRLSPAEWAGPDENRVKARPIRENHGTEKSSGIRATRQVASSHGRPLSLSRLQGLRSRFDRTASGEGGQSACCWDSATIGLSAPAPHGLVRRISISEGEPSRSPFARPCPSRPWKLRFFGFIRVSRLGIHIHHRFNGEIHTTGFARLALVARVWRGPPAR
jgi:hypothetical protein